MKILKEVSTWSAEYSRQPNHTYLINSKNQIVAYAKWHSQKDIHVFKSRMNLESKYRKFIEVSHKGLEKIAKQLKDEMPEKQKAEKRIASANIRLFKVKSKSKDKEYIVEFNVAGKFLSCGCVGFGYRRKCSHVEAVAKKLGV